MQIVLIEPKIPQNTGSIARTCAALKVPLHLVGRLGFDISDKAVRRAGLDYWPYVDLFCHESWEDYLKSENPSRCWFVSKFGRCQLFDIEFEAEDVLVFGDEVKGLGDKFLNRYSEFTVRIPMLSSHVRSLNLSNAVSVVLYEALRQNNGFVR